MTYDEMIKVIQALKDGKDLEIKSKRGGLKWYLRPNNGQQDADLNFDSYDYRVKREPRVLYARIDAHGNVCSTDTNRKGVESFHRQYGGEIVKFVEVMED